MFRARSDAQFAHFAEDEHLVGMVDEFEVIERSLHAGRVGVVGIHDELVVLSVHQFRTVVLRNIVADGMGNLFGCHAKVCAYAGRSQSICGII